MGIFFQGGDWGDDGVLLFEPHTRPVGCMAFSTARPTQLLSLSYDGSLRCMDVEKAVFDDVRNLLCARSVCILDHIQIKLFSRCMTLKMA